MGYVRAQIIDPTTGRRPPMAVFLRVFAPQLEARQAMLADLDPFEPTEQQRAIVAAATLAAGANPDLEAIARLIIRQDTHRPITVGVLKRHFAHELAHAEQVVYQKLSVSSVILATQFMDGPQLRYEIDRIDARREHKQQGTGAILLLPADAPQEEWERMAQAQQSALMKEAQGDAE